jgi:hypothetical protein
MEERVTFVSWKGELIQVLPIIRDKFNSVSACDFMPVMMHNGVGLDNLSQAHEAMIKGEANHEEQEVIVVH